MKLEETVLETILREDLIAENDRVYAAVSGGADSVCLLSTLKKMERGGRVMGKRAPFFTLCCAHVHHGLRGESADGDERFVRDLCRDMDVPFQVKRIDAASIAESSTHLSVEAAARQGRYAALRETTAKEPQAKIATAHQLDDNAETTLLHLFRGSGMRGLQGVAYRRDNIIRPLLDVTRDEIEAYLQREGLFFRTDESNFDDAYTRNRIRKTLMDDAKSKVNAQAARHVAAASRDVRRALSYLEKQTCEAYARCEKNARNEQERGAVCFSVDALQKEDAYLRSEIVRRAFNQIAPSFKPGYETGRAHIDAVLRLCASSNGRAELQLPQGVRVYRLHDTLVLAPALEKGRDT